MRGEKSQIFFIYKRDLGSPPHARGKAYDIKKNPDGSRITPACAGKRERTVHAGMISGDHPRMRGEKVNGFVGYRPHQGSPPHARGKVRQNTSFEFRQRITPACAGKSTWALRALRYRRDHPRMRGEKEFFDKQNAIHGGSPPHARGKGIWTPQAANIPRITPACAGKSP